MRTQNPDGSVGDPVVLTVRLPLTAAEYAAFPNTFSKVTLDLDRAAPAATSQKTFAWIDIKASDGACGTSLGDDSVVFEASCDIYPSATSTWPYGGTYILVHELTHNFGAVDTCAPRLLGAKPAPHRRPDPGCTTGSL